jgi:hypothetical protein
MEPISGAKSCIVLLPEDIDFFVVVLLPGYFSVNLFLQNHPKSVFLDFTTI